MRRLSILAALVLLIAVGSCGDDDTTTPKVNPVAGLSVSPSSGTAITDFVFDATTSTPAEGLQYRWDWDSDGVWDTGWSDAATVTKRFTEGNAIAVTMEVSIGDEADTTSTQVTLDARHGYVLKTYEIFPVMDRAACLAYGDSRLWFAAWGSAGTPGRIYEMDPATGDTLRSIAAPSLWPNALEWADGFLYVSDHVAGDAKIFKENPATGEVLGGFNVVYSTDVGGLAWDGENFHFGSAKDGVDGDGRIHRYAPDGSHLSDIPSPRPEYGPRGLAFDGVHLWTSTAGADSLFVLDPEDGAVVRTVPVNYRPTDLASDGTHIWVIHETHVRVFSKIVP